jgi:hypothetical protein
VVAGTGSLDLLVDLPPATGAALLRCGGDDNSRIPDGDDGSNKIQQKADRKEEGQGRGGGGEGSAAVAAGSMAFFWATAKECNRQTREWIDKGWARESLLLFSSGWEFMNMNRVVELGAQDRATLGRAYSVGLSNVGVFAHETSFGGKEEEEEERGEVEIDSSQSGSGGEPADEPAALGRASKEPLSLSQLYFGISQTVSAPAVSVSSVTVKGRLCLTVQGAFPIWPEDELEAFADNLIQSLEVVAPLSP